MNKFKFMYKFIISKPNSKKINWNLLFPFGGVIIGCLTVALTLSIMEGMENVIFTQLKNLSLSARLLNVISTNKEELEKYLLGNKIKYQDGIEDEIMISNNDKFRIVTLHGIEKFKEFTQNVFFSELTEINSSLVDSQLYIGRSLAMKLDISLGDTIYITHADRINIFTGLPNRKQMTVGGIFDVNILDYNQKHIYCQKELLDNFLPEKGNIFYLNNPLGKQELQNLRRIFPGLKYNIWEENHGSFIAAMKLEKLIYSLVGFLIVGISGFTLMSMMSLSVIQKIPQIGILRAMGMKAIDIKYLFISQAIFTAIISSTIGIIFSLLIIQLDNEFNIIHFLFQGGLFFDFPLILKEIYIVIIFMVSLVLLIIAGLFPSIKASQIDPVNAIGFRR